MSEAPMSEKFEEMSPAAWSAQCLGKCIPGRVYRTRERSIDAYIENHEHEMQKIPLYNNAQMTDLIAAGDNSE